MEVCCLTPTFWIFLGLWVFLLLPWNVHWDPGEDFHPARVYIHSANYVSYSVAQCSLSWLHIIYHLPIPNSTKLRITHLSATSLEQFHNTQEIERMKVTIPHGMTRLTACRRLLLMYFKAMHAACTRDTQPGFCRTLLGIFILYNNKLGFEASI